MRRLVCLLWLVTLLLLPGRPAWAQVDAGFFGTWQLDSAGSTWGPAGAPYKRGTWTITELPSGEVMMVYDQVGTRGGVTHMEWRGRFDGNDYRLQGPDALVTYAYRLVDTRTLELLVKVDGRPTAGSRVSLGADGRLSAETRADTARGLVRTVSVYTKR